MSNSKYDVLKLENQLCFPLYAAAREVVKRYRPHLDAIDLTYFLTDSGEELKKKAVDIPAKVAGCVGLDGEEALQLYRLLYKVLGAGER